MAMIKNKSIKNIIIAGLVVSLMSPNVVLASELGSHSLNQISEQDNEYSEYRIAKAKISIKKSKSSRATTIGYIYKGDVFRPLSIEGDWAKVECKKGIGYISTENLRIINNVNNVDLTDGGIIVSENFRVLSKEAKITQRSSRTSKVLGTLKQGDVVKVLSQSSGVGKIDYNGNNGYIDMDDLEYISSNVQSKLGKITVRYVDSEKQTDISESETYSGLEYNKEYSYTAKSIAGYNLKGENATKVKLTTEKSPYELVFEYDEIKNDSVEPSVPEDVVTPIEPSVPEDTEDNIKVLGEVVVNYLDKDTNDKIAETIFYTDLELGEYIYLAKDIEGYDVVGEGSSKVVLTKDESKKEINFVYEKRAEEVVPPQVDEIGVNINEVPYISSYYIKPIVKPGENVKLEYYVTDFYQKETREGKSDAVFTVRVKIDGKEDIVKTNVKPGDNSIDLGKFTTEGEQKFSIVATDQYGRNSHELFNYFLVRNDVEVKEYKMTEADLAKYNIKVNDNYENVIWVNVPSQGITNNIVTAAVEAEAKKTPKSKTYNSIRVAVDGKERRNSYWKFSKTVYASDYDKDAVLAESKANREGLQKLLDDKANEGYNKVTLLKGVYRIDHEQSLYIPTKMTVDMNKATIKLNQFTGDKAVMVQLNNTFDSHLINGIIEGDYYTHDYAGSPNSSEWVNGVEFIGEAKYSSVENVVVRDITGYGGQNGIGGGRDGLSTTYFYPKGFKSFKLGDIDRKTGEEIESSERSVSDYLDIKTKRLAKDDTEGGYIQIGKYLGYQGNPCGTWNIICHFYDKDKNYIESVDGYLYRRIGVPKDAQYARVSILSTTVPTDSDLSAYYFRVPTHSAFKNVTFENCRAVGLAQAAMKDMLVEGCEFVNSGQALAKCAYDAEDGWDMMQDATFRKLNFHDNPYNEFLTCAGHNFVVEDMVQGNMYVWERTNSLVYRNSKSAKDDIFFKLGARRRSGYPRIYNNEINGKINVLDSGAIEDGWSMVVRNNKINGRAENAYGVAKYVDCEITSADGVASSLGAGEFKNCYINNKSGENQGGIYRNCKIENIKGNLHKQFDIQDSELKNVDFKAGNYDAAISIKNSKLENVGIQYPYWHKGVEVNIDNCEINNGDYLLKLPHYSMKKQITIKNSKFNSIGKNGMVWFYDDRTGGSAGEAGPQEPLTIEGTTINMENSSQIVNGLKKDTKNHITLVSKSNIYDKSKIELCNPEARENKVIKITEEN